MGGSDYDIYRGVYNSTPKFPEALAIDNASSLFERGYMYISAFFRTLNISFYGFTVFHAIIFYTCLWYGLKRYTKHFGIVILVFLYKLFFYNTFISMRQSLTIAAFFLMMHFIEEKKPFKYYILCFFISFIHNGALLLFLLYPLAYMNLTKKKIIWLNIIFVPTILIGFSEINIFEQIGDILSSYSSLGENQMAVHKIERFFENENLSSIGIFHTIEYLVLMFFVLKNYDYIIKTDRHAAFILKLFLCLLPLFTLFRGSEILTREKDYFTLTYAIILGYLCQIQYGKYKINTIIATIIICAFGYFRFAYSFNYSEMMNYKSWIFENVSFFN